MLANPLSYCTQTPTPTHSSMYWTLKRWVLLAFLVCLITLPHGIVLADILSKGTLTDISERRMLQQAQLSMAQEREAAARRQAEESELRRQEAEERRRAQELLIDVTSHELRQPVSAILNCASLVRSNYQALKSYLKASSLKESGFHPSSELFDTIDEDLEALGMVDVFNSDCQAKAVYTVDAIYQCGLSQERIANELVKPISFITTLILQSL